MKHGVRRQRASGVDALARSASIAGRDDVDVFGAERAVLAGMGIEARYRKPGRARPKCVVRSATAIRAVATIRSVDSSPSASRSERWMVTGTTASAGDHSIITGCGAWPPSAASSARNSVWPGWRKPARYSTLLAIGLVTTAPARPRLTCRPHGEWRRGRRWRCFHRAVREARLRLRRSRPRARPSQMPRSRPQVAASARSTCNPRIFARAAKNARSPSR